MVGSQLMSTSVALPRYRPSSTMIGMEKFVPPVQRQYGRAYTRLLKRRTGRRQNGELGLSLIYVYWITTISGLNFIFYLKTQDVLLQARFHPFHWTRPSWKSLLIFFDTSCSVLRVLSEIPMPTVPTCGNLCKIKSILFFRILTDGMVPSKVKCVELQFSQISFPTPKLDMLVSHSWLKEKLVYTSPYTMDYLLKQWRWG